MLGIKLILLSVVKKMKKSLNWQVQVSQHLRAEHRASAKLVVAKSVTIKESKTDCC